jgi:hypothetical protein
MVNKVTGYYTTDQEYRAVASNHISEISYDAESLNLYIKFYNGAYYVYYGIPKGLYDGLISSPSHGVFFWENIRQRFHYDLLNEAQAKPGKGNIEAPSSILSEIYPELVKLDKLDVKEKKLTNDFNKGRIPFGEYDRALVYIQTERDKLCTKLEKKGYFEQELAPESGNDSKPTWEAHMDTVVSLAIWVWIGVVSCYKLILWTIRACLMIVGVMAGIVFALMK